MQNPSFGLLRNEIISTRNVLPDSSPIIGGFYSNSVYESIVTAITEKIRRRAGLMVLTGESGTGKTSVIQRIASLLDPTCHSVLFLDPHFSFADLIGFADQQLGFSGSRSGSTLLQDRLHDFRDYLDNQYWNQCPIIFFIDDAQNIAENVLADLLKLQELKAGEEHLIQIVLAGLPELELKLYEPALWELTADSLPPYRLAPLQDGEIGNFIAQQFGSIPSSHSDFFSTEAIARIAFYSRGVPRLIKVLCENAQFAAILNHCDNITVEVVEEAAKMCALTLSGNDVAQEKQKTQTNPVSVSTSPRLEVTRNREERSLVDTSNKTPRLKMISSSQQERSMFQTENVREKNGNRTESLNKILKNLQSGSPDVEAVALISDDGLMIASVLPQYLDETRVAGMSATLLALGVRAGAELRRGSIEEVIVRGEDGYAVMIAAVRGVLLLVLTNEHAKLGLVFFDMREAINALKRVL